jgi:hypothetical protein
MAKFVSIVMETQYTDKQGTTHEAWGQLCRIALIRLLLEQAFTLNLTQSRSFFVAVIRRVNATRDRYNIIQYTRDGQIDLVDFNSVHCVVGRVKDRGRWSILDRSEGQCNATFSTQPDMA